MKPERLHRRIILQRLVRTYDVHNQPTESWEDLTTVWASWRRAGSNERLAAGQVGAQVTDIFEMRWSSDIEAVDPKDRLVYDGETYDIAEVTEIGRRDGMLIRAAAKADIS